MRIEKEQKSNDLYEVFLNLNRPRQVMRARKEVIP